MTDSRAEVTAGKVGIHQWNVPLDYILSNEWLVVGVVTAPPFLGRTNIYESSPAISA